jgi:hypothetical protein
MERQLASLGLPEGVSTSFYQTNLVDVGGIEGLRPLIETGVTAKGLQISVSEPAATSVNRVIQVAISDKDDERTAIVLLKRDRNLPEGENIDLQDVLPFEIEDVQPQLTTVSTMRLNAFVRRFLSEALKDLLDPALDALISKGYRRP